MKKKLIKKFRLSVLNLEKYISKNRLTLFNTFLLIWLCFRMEQLHAIATLTLSFLLQVSTEIAFKLQEVNMVFGHAVQSIISLFRGEAS